VVRIENNAGTYAGTIDNYKIALDGYTLPTITQRTFVSMTLNLYYYED